MASTTSWIDPRSLAIIIDPVKAGEIYAKLDAEPPEALAPDETLWLASIAAAGEQATWVIRSMLNAKIHPAECWQETYRQHGRTIVLRQGPVESVDLVEAVDPCDEDAESTALEGWCWAGDNAVTLNGASLGACNRTEMVRVHYRTKDNLPPGTMSHLVWLAEQHNLASTGQSCALPERVTNITRQGVSWTMLDPMDFLTKGMTGVGRIDSWLSTARREHPSAAMYDPYKSDRVKAVLVECGSTTQPGSGYGYGPYGDSE